MRNLKNMDHHDVMDRWLSVSFYSAKCPNCDYIVDLPFDSVYCRKCQGNCLGCRDYAHIVRGEVARRVVTEIELGVAKEEIKSMKKEIEGLKEELAEQKGKTPNMVYNRLKSRLEQYETDRRKIIDGPH